MAIQVSASIEKNDELIKAQCDECQACLISQLLCIGTCYAGKDECDDNDDHGTSDLYDDAEKLTQSTADSREGIRKIVFVIRR